MSPSNPLREERHEPGPERAPPARATGGESPVHALHDRLRVEFNRDVDDVDRPRLSAGQLGAILSLAILSWGVVGLVAFGVSRLI